MERPSWVGGLVAVALSLALPAASQAAPSERVYYDDSGRLRSVADASGNRIPDYSHAGYRGGGVELPQVPTVQTIGPLAGDNRAHLQAAIDAIAAMPLGPNGFRGALELEPGRYAVSGTVHVNADGIVVRGAGRGSDTATNTLIVRTGSNDGPVIVLGGDIDGLWVGGLPEQVRLIVTGQDYVTDGQVVEPVTSTAEATQ